MKINVLGQLTLGLLLRAHWGAILTRKSDETAEFFFFPLPFFPLPCVLLSPHGFHGFPLMGIVTFGVLKKKTTQN